MKPSNKRAIWIALVIVIVSVCLGVAIAGGFWATGPSLDCLRPDQGPAQPGWSARTVLSGGEQRCYHLYVPKGHDASQAAPLVLSFHGFLLNPDTQAAITGWHKLADREGFLVAYPQGTGWPRRWNAGETWGATEINDTDFLRDMIEDVAGLAAVDHDRVYANGFSNGGGISAYLGCNAADVVAAIGSVAGAVVSMDGCEPARPVPVMAFHGTEDWIVPYAGGSMGVAPLRLGADLVDGPSEFVAAQDWTADFAELNGCDLQPETIPPVEDVLGQRYLDCDDDADVVLYTIERGGHQWPGGGTITGAGHNTQAIDATEEMWRFFQNYRLGE